MKNCIFTCLLLMATSTANATLINIDFGPSTSPTYDGQGILGTGADTTWNSVNVGTPNNVESTNLDYADGTGASGVAVTVDGAWDFNGNNTDPGGTAVGTNPLLGDRIANVTPNEPATITLTGLTAGQLYDIVLYAGFYAQDYSISGQSITATINPVYPGGASSSYPDWQSGEEYVVLASVVADSSGEVGILVDPLSCTLPTSGIFCGSLDSGSDTNGYAEIAGMQIQAVPLPAAMYLFGTGLLGLAGIAKRKKTA